MSRKAPIITKERFSQLLDEFNNKNSISENRVVSKDLSKVSFDWENQDIVHWMEPVIILSNGLPVCWMYAGGDWEYPVHFVLYWDGKYVRGYIPDKGNIYNREKKMALGNNGEDTEDEKIKPDFILMAQDIVKHIKIVK
jgi:hypothetical protein